MTKPQIWVAAFLFLFIALFMLGRITKDEEVPTKDFSHMNNTSMGGQQTEEITGASLIKSFGCLNCHGDNLEGSAMGPALTNLTQFWGRDNLLNYLRNPNSFMDSDRFKEYKKRFPNQMMPSYGNKDVKDLGKIADYLLTL